MDPEQGSLRRPPARTLLALTFVTGLVDAASYLGLGHVFTANMTGNVLLLGFAIGGATGLPIVGHLISLTAFLVGAVAGGRVARRLAGASSTGIAAVLTAEAVMLLPAAVICAVARVPAGSAAADAVIALLALGMGTRNATVRAFGIPDLNTTVLTTTLTALAADSPPAGGNGTGSLRRFSAASVLLAGAIAGALLERDSMTAVTFVAFGIAAAIGPAYRLAAGRQAAAEREADGSASAPT